jgi:hypothetical protein
MPCAAFNEFSALARILFWSPITTRVDWETAVFFEHIASLLAPAKDQFDFSVSPLAKNLKDDTGI